MHILEEVASIQNAKYAACSSWWKPPWILAYNGLFSSQTTTPFGLRYAVMSPRSYESYGVVELCLALHSVFDFRRDRLIWDTGHQIYPHKLITGRYHEFGTIRTKNGLMGYPNPEESPYDLFMTGHAGCSVSTALGLRSGDILTGHPDRQSVAVIGPAIQYSCHFCFHF